MDWRKKMTEMINLITIFALAIFLGVELITKVPATLHTPLMSGSNAISGITIVGSVGVMITVDLTADAAGFNDEARLVALILGALAIVFATINVVGGFVVTNRMLQKFKGRK
jgi:NAD(P) transhydrogenase subunit alpha